MPPLTPIEEILYRAMRERDLAPVAQYGIGHYRADFAFLDVRLVVECDGRPWHDPDRDRERDAALRRQGWEPLHFTGSDISRDAAACAARVQREVLLRRATAESEQPDITIPVRRSWWTRLLQWLRSQLRRAPSGTAHAQVLVECEYVELERVDRFGVARHIERRLLLLVVRIDEGKLVLRPRPSVPLLARPCLAGERSQGLQVGYRPAADSANWRSPSRC
jgi:very-short-patch-repair endonuclease